MDGIHTPGRGCFDRMLLAATQPALLGVTELTLLHEAHGADGLALVVINGQPFWDWT